MFGIKITYSWGDEEPMNSYGKYETEREAFAKACELAGREAYVQNEEMNWRNTCTIEVDASALHIDLCYHHDMEHCYYDVKEYNEED